jgi:hypothetical protein
VSNSFEENDCENANTRAQGGDHLLVLAHLQRQWSLRGKDGFGAFCGSETPIFHNVDSGDFL